MADLEHRIARLEAIESIKRVIARYARGADRNNDPAIMRPLFTEDAVWESKQYTRVEGREEIVETMSWGGTNIIKWAIHYMISPVIDIHEDLQSASAEWYLWEPMTARHTDGTDADTWSGSVYKAEFKRMGDDSWKIKYLNLDLKLLAKVGESWPGPIDVNQIDGQPI